MRTELQRPLTQLLPYEGDTPAVAQRLPQPASLLADEFQRPGIPSMFVRGTGPS